MRVRIDDVIAIRGPQAKPSIASEQLELGSERFDDAIELEVLGVSLLRAPIKARDIEQAAQQVLARDQGGLRLRDHRRDGR